MINLHKGFFSDKNASGFNPEAFLIKLFSVMLQLSAAFMFFSRVSLKTGYAERVTVSLASALS